MSSSGERPGSAGGPGTATTAGHGVHGRGDLEAPNGEDREALKRRGGEAPDGGDRATTTDPGRPRTKAAQREATTAALVDAARELFAGRGYANVGTEEIVRQAGVTRGALYHHFRGGKEELFRAVVVQISAETAGRVRNAARANDDPWIALVDGIDAFLDACALPEVQRVLLVDGPAVLGWDVWRTIDSEYGLGLLEAALRRAIDAGRLPPQPARAAAHVLLGALDESAMVVARADDPRAARAEMGQTVHRLLEGLRVPVR